MRRKKFSEIKTKEDRQEFLNYMLEKELEKIRKKIYKYQRRDTLWHEVTIEEKDLKHISAAGQYEWDKDNGVHKIYIDSRIINDYLNKRPAWNKYHKRIIINTIGHEITHGLVQEKFEHIYRKIEHKNYDGSPIFLSVLLFLGYSSNHHCAYNFSGSKVWKDIVDLKKNNGTWNEFIDYIFFYLQAIEDIREQFNKDHQTLGQTIDFRFSSRGSGLRKMSQSAMDITAYVTNKKEFRNMRVTSTTFEVGSMMYAEKIKELIPKKLANEFKADIQITSFKKVLCNDETQYSKWVYEKEETYNKYTEQKTAQIIN